MLELGSHRVRLVEPGDRATLAQTLRGSLRGWRRGVLPPGPMVNIKVPGDRRGNGPEEKQGGKWTERKRKGKNKRHWSLDMGIRK